MRYSLCDDRDLGRQKSFLKNFKLFFEKVLTLMYIRVIISESPDGDGNECGMLEKGLNSPAFHAGIHGFESRTCHSFWEFSSAGRASALRAGCRRFDPVNSHFFYAGVAQLAEQLICNQQVAGSSPITGLQRRQLLTRLSFLFRNSPFYSGT